jgi:hypothetical protein
VFVGGAVPEKIFVGVANPKAGKKISLDLGKPAVAIANKGGFRSDDKIGSIGGEGGALAPPSPPIDPILSSDRKPPLFAMASAAD